MVQRPSRRTALRRVLAVVLACATVAIASGAGAQSTKEQLEAAKRRFERLKTEIAAEQQRLDRLAGEASELAGRIEVAEGRYEQAAWELSRTTKRIGIATDELERLRIQLGERVRAAYINGPGSDLEFLLAAESLADLADRLTFVDALAEADLALADDVGRLAEELQDKAREQAELRDRRADALEALERQEAELDARLAEQQDIYAGILDRLAEAEELVERLGKEYAEELAAAAGGDVDTSGIFKVCPTDQPRAISDSFGAPRYGGGYHPHAGNDIMSPTGTPIRAPFDGIARKSSNTLGGLAVYVTGDDGYVYNAHLSSYTDRSEGPVVAGDIIGYVGTTGNATTPHNHFEWHPEVTPSDWPESPYGFSVVGTAANPWPLLQMVC